MMLNGYLKNTHWVSWGKKTIISLWGFKIEMGSLANVLT
jgi:hypothetical protein